VRETKTPPELISFEGVDGYPNALISVSYILLVPQTQTPSSSLL